MPEDFDAENYSADNPAFYQEQRDLEESQPRSLLHYKPREVRDMVASGAVSVDAGAQYVAYRDLQKNGIRNMTARNVNRLYKAGVLTQAQAESYVSYKKHPVWFSIKDVAKGAFGALRETGENAAWLWYEQSLWGKLKGDTSSEKFRKWTAEKVAGALDVDLPEQKAPLADVLPSPKDLFDNPDKFLPFQDVNPETGLGKVTMVAGEFLIPFAGGMKVIKGARALPRILKALPQLEKNAPKLAQFFKYTFNGTVAGAFADGSVDPDAGRISDMMDEYGLLPEFLQFMKTNPDNPEAVERLKNIAEGAVIGVALDAFIQGAKWLRNDVWKRNFSDPYRIAIDVDDSFGIFMEKKGLKVADNVPPPKEADVLAKQVDEIADEVPDPNRRLTPEELRPPNIEDYNKSFKDFTDIETAIKTGKEPTSITDFMEEAGGDTRLVVESIYKNHEKVMDRVRGGVADPKTGVRKSRAKTQSGAENFLKSVARSAGKTKTTMTDAMLRQMRRYGQDIGNMDSVVRAFNQYFTQYAQETAEMARRIVDPKVKTSLPDKLKALEHIKALQEMEMHVFGIRSDIGRTLGQYNLDWMATRFDFQKLPTESLTDIAAHQEREIDRIINSFQKASSHADRMKIARYTGRNRLLAGALEFMQANLLWDVGTQMVNLAGNFGTQFLEGALRHMAVTTYALTKSDMQAFRELGAFWHGIGTGLYQSFKVGGLKKWAKETTKENFFSEDVGRVWKALASGEGQLDSLVKLEGQAGSGIEESLKAMKMPTIMAKPLAKVVQMPFHALTAGDELFKNVAYYSELNSLLFREARKAGYVPGTKAWTEWMEGVTKNVPVDMHYEALNRARWLTFQDDFSSGSFGKKANELLNTNAGQILKIGAIPFFKIAYNITGFAAEHTPLGMFGKRFKADWAAGGIKRYEAIGRVATGSAILITAANLYDSGRITGRVPPGQENAWQNANKQPYSIRIGNTWYSYDRFDPFGMVLALGADLALLADIHEYNENVPVEDQEKMITAALLTLSEPVLNKTWMQGLADFIDLLTKADRMNAEKYLYRQVEKFVPFATAFEFYNRTFKDGTIPEMYSAMDAVYKKYDPERLLKKRHNVYGSPIEQEPRTAFMVKKRTMYDPLMIELHNIEANIKKPDMKIKGKELSPEEYHAFMDVLADMPVKEILTKVMNHPGYQRIQDRKKRREVMMKVNQRIRKGAEAIYLKKNPEFRQRVIDMLRDDARNILGHTVRNDAREALYHKLNIKEFD